MKFKSNLVIYSFIFLTIHIWLSNQQEKSYNYRREYSEKLSQIYLKYLTDETLNKECTKKGVTSQIKSNDILSAYSKTKTEFEALRKVDQNIIDKRNGIVFDSFVHGANLQAIYNELVSKSLIESNCLGRLDAVMNLKNISNLDFDGLKQEYCPLESDVNPYIKCHPNSKYRTIDGKCNNLLKSNWGTALHCQRRLLPPDFSDGVSKLRESTDGTPLPNPRLLSKTLFNGNSPASNHSSMLTMWGQAIAHDTFSRILYLGGPKGIICCPENKSTPIHSECIPMYENRDEISKAFNQNCMTVMRAVACNSCNLGYRNQLNLVTSYLDLSFIYGFSDKLSKTLRTYKNGELITGRALDNTSIILPKAKLEDQDEFDITDCMPGVDRPWLSCFKSGDGIRGNQNPGGTALVTILVRRHNQHCRGLAKVNPKWNDERLFQEARKLSIAEYNKINFGEYFPIILYPKQMESFGLNLKRKGFTQYNPNVDPNVILSVGAAAFRFGHMTTPSIFQILNKPFYESFGFKLRNKYFEMSDLWDGMTNGIIRGLMEVPERVMGPHMVPDLQDYLFMERSNPIIRDLAAFNIQRGRDYGLPAYIYYLEYTQGFKIKKWDDLKQFISPNGLNELKNIYKDYRDIDLFVGGVMEKGIKTFTHLMAIQFYHWKFGDRFYFEHEGHFTKNQLKNIRKTSSMANLLCKTTDLESITSNPFFIQTKSNKIVPCNKFKEINYKLFKE